MNKLTEKQKKLYQRISKILWKDWDPIGVYEPNAEWDDEYDSYVPHLFRLAIEGKDLYHIANSLNSVRTQSIGLGPNKEADQFAASKIIDSKREILD